MGGGRGAVGLDARLPPRVMRRSMPGRGPARCPAAAAQIMRRVETIAQRCKKVVDKFGEDSKKPGAPEALRWGARGAPGLLDS